MAGREVGLFTPTEAAYTRPGGYEAALGAEATRLGTYESEMASFYEQLEQEEEQFAGRMALEERRIASEEQRATQMLAWYREQEAGRLTLSREQLATQTSTQRYVARQGAGGGGGGGRTSIYGTPFEPYLTTSEQPQPEITMDWLTQQLGSMYAEPTGPVTGPSEGRMPYPGGGTSTHYTGA